MHDARVKVLTVSAVLLVALAGLATAAVAAWSRLSPGPAIAVDGSVLVKGDRPQVLTEDELTCTTGAGYDDIRQGAQVVVSDAAGKTIALGQLGGGSWKRDVGCVFLFTVPDVPMAGEFFGLEVSHRGRVQYSAGQLAEPLDLVIG